jgi:putative protease
MTSGTQIGEVTHFFGKIKVAVIKLTDSLKVGDTIHFLGRNTDFDQEVTSMQIEHETITVAESDSEVAIKTSQRVRKGDSVFLLSPESEA